MDLEPVSKQEKVLREIVRDVLPEVEAFYNVRPDWLKNPMTGKNLEIDIYLPSVNLGFEYNGFQHTTIDMKRGVGIDQVKSQYQRDRVKYNLLERQGVHLYVITHEDLKREAWLREQIVLWAEKGVTDEAPPRTKQGPIMINLGFKTVGFHAFKGEQHAKKQHWQMMKQHKVTLAPLTPHELTPYEKDFLARSHKGGKQLQKPAKRYKMRRK